MPAPVASGDLVLLLGPDGERHVVRVRDETARVGGLGVLRLSDLIGRPWGDRVRLGLKDYLLLHPVLGDHTRSLERRAQIITPKDASRILFETGLGAGGRVAEAGVGSGALTLALAHAVGETGRVFAYDLRQEHLDVGRRNLDQAGLTQRVDLRLGDVRQGVPERDLDAFVLDIPDPEVAINAAKASLRPGGVLAVYAPIVVQVERAVQAVRGAGFVDIQALELIERAWVVHERGSRPDFGMLGHTGFLVFARRS